eukprot:gene13836-13957_t
MQYDGANVLKLDARNALAEQLRDLDRETGFHVRVFTQYEVDASRTGPNPRQLWGSLDNKTVVVRVDPSSPNILSVPFIGDEVLAKLRRPFWTELESRFGNMFYVREQGDAVAVLGAMGALVQCLGQPEGCRVVPGLPPEQYFFTLWCSIAGGFVQRRWVWLLLFSPLWASLFINFGLGPIVTRTSDIGPIAGNVAGFLAAALAPTLVQKAWDSSGGQQTSE